METLFKNQQGVEVRLNNDQLVEINGVVFKVTSIQNEPIKQIKLEPANADGIAEFQRGQVNAPKLGEGGVDASPGFTKSEDIAMPIDEKYPNETNGQRGDRLKNQNKGKDAK